MLYLPYAAFLSSVVSAVNIPNVQNNHLKLEFSVWKGDSRSSATKGGNAKVVSSDDYASLYLANAQTYYSASLKLGSNGDENNVLVDSGSSDLWVMASDVSCHTRDNLKKRNTDEYSGFSYRHILDFDDESSTENMAKRSYSGDSAVGASYSSISATSSSSLSIVSTAPTCALLGSFNTAASKSYKFNATAPPFSIKYNDGTYAYGVWGTDYIAVGSLNVSDVSIAVVNDTTSDFGVFGIGLPSLEMTYYHGSRAKAYQYENFPIRLKSTGVIKKVAYSLYLNDTDSSSGTVLFGAVDHNKYYGQLQTVPIINIYSSSFSTPVAFYIGLDSITLGDSNENIGIYNETIPALLDSGTTLTYLPSALVDSIAASLNGTATGGRFYEVDCEYNTSSAYLDYNLSGVHIKAPLSDLILTNDAGTKCFLGLVGSKSRKPKAILGDSFLRHAYVVYNLEDYEISLAPVRYSDSEDIEVISSTIPSAVQAPGYSSTSVVSTIPAYSGTAAVLSLPIDPATSATSSATIYAAASGASSPSFYSTSSSLSSPPRYWNSSAIHSAVPSPSSPASSIPGIASTKDSESSYSGYFTTSAEAGFSASTSGVSASTISAGTTVPIFPTSGASGVSSTTSSDVATNKTPGTSFGTFSTGSISETTSIGPITSTISTKGSSDKTSISASTISTTTGTSEVTSFTATTSATNLSDTISSGGVSSYSIASTSVGSDTTSSIPKSSLPTTDGISSVYAHVPSPLWMPPPTSADAGSTGTVITDTLTNSVGTTIITITSCFDHKCTTTTVPATQGPTTVTNNGETTIYTTWCPITSTAVTESLENSGTAAVSTGTITDIVATTIITITSCSDHKCTETTVSATQGPTTMTTNGVTTVFTTWCPLTSPGASAIIGTVSGDNGIVTKYTTTSGVAHFTGSATSNAGTISTTNKIDGTILPGSPESTVFVTIIKTDSDGSKTTYTTTTTAATVAAVVTSPSVSTVVTQSTKASLSNGTPAITSGNPVISTAYNGAGKIGASFAILVLPLAYFL
ncbi:hypothetical protein JCM33374_g5175 [Metschnikowia sp. JCM 33374]|nr:hypothetical protein JCM33374_g5175 [Metschnikowia sp. JCM 33374]